MHNLIMNAHTLPFELKKNVYNLLSFSLKISNEFVKYLQNDIESIKNYLFDK